MYYLTNVRMCGNEHGQLKANVIYAELRSEDGSLSISATLEHILCAIRDRNLQVEGIAIEFREYSRGKESQVQLLWYK